MINIRSKGATGEREVADALNAVLRDVRIAVGAPLPEKASVQRNPLQSAVGGNDLTGTLGMSIEIKRQENLSVNTWWEQCKRAAEPHQELPVLLYRQNGKKWRAVTLVWLALPDGSQVMKRAEFEWTTFLEWWREWCIIKLTKG